MFRRSQRAVRQQLKELRHFIGDPESDLLAVRVAQAMEDTLLWATKDMRGMDRRVSDAISAAGLIRVEYAQDRIDMTIQ